MPQNASKRKQYKAINAFSLAQPQCATENALLNEKLIGAFLSRYPFPNGVVEEAIPPATPVLLSGFFRGKNSCKRYQKSILISAIIRTLSLNKT